MIAARCTSGRATARSLDQGGPPEGRRGHQSYRRRWSTGPRHPALCSPARVRVGSSRDWRRRGRASPCRFVTAAPTSHHRPTRRMVGCRSITRTASRRSRSGLAARRRSTSTHRVCRADPARLTYSGSSSPRGGRHENEWQYSARGICLVLRGRLLSQSFRSTPHLCFGCGQPTVSGASSVRAGRRGRGGGALSSSSSRTTRAAGYAHGGVIRGPRRAWR